MYRPTGMHVSAFTQPMRCQLNSTQLYLFQTEKQTENTMRNGWMEQD